MLRLSSYVICLLLVFFTGCARLPDYARPAFHEPTDTNPSAYEGFSYRALTQADFKATSLTGMKGGFKHNIQARSCISIRPAADTKMRITNSVIGGKAQYLGSYSNVAFQAMFNPACSWWNPKIPAKRIRYVLEYEQIHFGLTELKAREVTKNHKERLQGYLAIGDSFAEVRQDLISQLQSVTHAALQEDLTVHTEFDEETSIYYAPALQKKWLDRVDERLSRVD